MIFKSVRHTPQVSTLTRSSPGPGSGTSSASGVSGLPNATSAMLLTFDSSERLPQYQGRALAQRQELTNAISLGLESPITPTSRMDARTG